MDIKHKIEFVDYFEISKDEFDIPMIQLGIEAIDVELYCYETNTNPPDIYLNLTPNQFLTELYGK